jgi:NAD(P)-dependent dehydrogenase (short-subunit alcohol dehydrogenase family)
MLGVRRTRSRTGQEVRMLGLVDAASGVTRHEGSLLMTTLNGKKLVVLGGTSGIGLAAAKAGVLAGATVVVASSRRQSVDAAVAELGASATGHVADLADESQARALFERIGELDHLIFTAGENLLLGPLASLDLATVRRAFELRVFGAIAAAQHDAPRIRAGGSIVLTHGIAGRRPPQPGWTVGTTICGAIESLTRALAVELAPVRVNAVSPGFVRTPLWGSIPEADREAMYRDAGARLLTRKVGEPQDIAEAYMYLLGNGFTTGQTLVVDGGGTLT